MLSFTIEALTAAWLKPKWVGMVCREGLCSSERSKIHVDRKGIGVEAVWQGMWLSEVCGPIGIS